MSARAAMPAPDPLSKRRLKMWIRMLGVVRATEGQLREFLRLEHATTLPRFDVMAALWRRRDGVTMSELSRMLLVSNGNATAIVDRLERDGLVRRTPSASDRRIVHVALTDAGMQNFEVLAAAHERKLAEILGGLDGADTDTIAEILKKPGRGDRA